MKARFAAVLVFGLVFVSPALVRAQDSSSAVTAKVAEPGQSQQTVAPAQISAKTLTLDELVSEALARNPAIQSTERRVAAMKARIPQAKTLPDPKVSVGWMGNITPFDVQEGDPSSYRSVSAMQEFPYPGKLKLRGQIADREAEAVWWEYEKTRRRVVAEVKAAYYDYFFFDKAIEITLKNKELLEKLTKIAEVRYQVGKGIQQDVLRAQVELSRLLQRLTVLEQQKKTAQVRLNTLLFRDPEAPLAAPAPFERAKLAYTLEELYQKARQNDTGLQRDQRLIERDQYAVNLARKEYYPDFSVGYMYQNRPRIPEMHGFTFTLNIPIFYKTKQREEVTEATNNLLSTQKAQEDRQTTLFFEVKEQYLAAKASDGLVKLFAQAVVPQSSLALESSMAAYQVGTVDFLTLLDNFITVLDYQVNYYRELSNYEMALARLEPLVGVELTK
jgi:cobalt-zinc-cadmium efflux system outer membrane protein